MQITLLAVVTLLPAPMPKAMLLPPVVLLNSANAPSAVLKLAVVLLKRAPAPTAVFSIPWFVVGLPHVGKERASAYGRLNWPSVSLRSDKNPTAVLNVPLVRLRRALCPSAVLPPG